MIYVQQYRWNKWIRIEGTEMYVDSGFVSFDLAKEKHTGNNQYRIVSSDPFSRKTSSAALYLFNKAPNFDYHYIREDNLILFDEWTRYEFYDSYGNLIKKGQGVEFNIAKYKKGLYYLNYDNSNVKVHLKPKKK